LRMIGLTQEVPACHASLYKKILCRFAGNPEYPSGEFNAKGRHSVDFPKSGWQTIGSGRYNYIKSLG
jgi:hypothetical protein